MKWLKTKAQRGLNKLFLKNGRPGLDDFYFIPDTNLYVSKV